MARDEQLEEAVNAIIQGMDNLHTKIKGEVEELRSEMNIGFDEMKNDKRLYFVAETKSVPEGATENLRRNELLKIECGKAHFAEFDDVDYRQVRRLRELL